MQRRSLLIAGVAGGAIAPYCALGQQRAKPALVVILGMNSPGPAAAAFIEPFKQSLRDLGWIEGENITFEARWALGRMDRLPAVAREVVALKPDVIWTSGTAQAVAARQATSTIPIVFTSSSDPVRAGLADSLGRPGGNATGLSDQQLDYAPKLLQFLYDVRPGLSRVGWLRNPSNVADEYIRQRLQDAAPAMKLSLVLGDVAAPEALDDAFVLFHREGVEAVIVSGDLMISALGERIDELLLKYRLPAAFLGRIARQRNGLLSYGRNTSEAVRRSAGYVDRILRGARPADLPIEQPAEMGLVINMGAARALGLTIPRSMLLRANEVIE